MTKKTPPKKKAPLSKAFYRKIGAKGGRNSTFRGFRDIPGLAERAGSMKKKRNWGWLYMTKDTPQTPADVELERILTNFAGAVYLPASRHEGYKTADLDEAKRLLLTWRDETSRVLPMSQPLSNPLRINKQQGSENSRINEKDKTATAPSSREGELHKQLEEKLLLVLLKSKVTPNKLYGWHFDLPDDALDAVVAWHTQQVETAVKTERDRWMAASMKRLVKYDQTGIPSETQALIETAVREKQAQIDLIKKQTHKLNAGLIAVDFYLNKPYPDDPRWTPYTRFIGPRLKMLSRAVFNNEEIGEL